MDSGATVASDKAWVKPSYFDCIFSITPPIWFANLRWWMHWYFKLNFPWWYPNNLRAPNLDKGRFGSCSVHSPKLFLHGYGVLCTSYSFLHEFWQLINIDNNMWRSTSTKDLSSFLPRTSTNWGSTDKGVEDGVTVGNVNLICEKDVVW